MVVYSEHSLKKYNTFGLSVNARKVVICENIDDIRHAFQNNDQLGIIILGGGSNVLFRKDIESTVLLPGIQGIDIIKKDHSYVCLEVGAGVNWDSLVHYCVRNGFGGLENLSLIPGNVGASPIQNIGAYGVEVKDHILSVKGIFRENLERFELSGEECGFGYRDSIFKKELKNKTVITSVLFKLTRKHKYCLDYGILRERVRECGNTNLENIRKAVIQIRTEKLPDPEKYGNAGSFFKNPEISVWQYEKLKKSYPEIPSYSTAIGVKIPAAWLIEHVGLKGFRRGECGTFPTQPLVIVNYGNATGNEIFQFSNYIRDKIKKTFGILFETEVNILP